MAFTVNQTSTGLRGSYDELIYVVNDDTDTGEPKYRYACEVILNSTRQALLRQLPNNAASAVFNVRNVIAQFVQQDEDVIEIGKSNSLLISTNTTAFKTVTVRFGSSFATSANAQPTLNLDSATDQNVELVNGNFTLATSALIDTNDSSAYVPTSGSKYWLSDTPEVNGLLINYVLYDDKKRSFSTLAFINTTSSSATHIGVRYYNGQTTLSTTVKANSIANGGMPPSSVTNDSQRLLYFGVGTANLGGQFISDDINPESSTNDGWTHYDVVLGSSTDPFTDAVSKTYRFVKLDCTRFQTANNYYTVHWWNSKGGYDSIVFSGKPEITQSLKRQGYRQIGGNSFDADGDTTDYVKNAYEGGMTQAHIRTKTTLNLNTAFLDPDRLSPLMMSLVNSERVYVSPVGDIGLNANRTGGGYVRAYVQDNSFTNRTSVKDGLTSFALQLEVSRYRPTR